MTKEFRDEALSWWLYHQFSRLLNDVTLGRTFELTQTLRWLADSAECGLGSTTWLNDYLEDEAKALEKRYAPRTPEEDEALRSTIKDMVSKMMERANMEDEEDSEELDKSSEDDSESSMCR